MSLRSLGKLSIGHGPTNQYSGGEIFFIPPPLIDQSSAVLYSIYNIGIVVNPRGL